MSSRSAIVVGAGIIGLATARALAVRGYKVTVLERNQFATGASVRNFGMIWPIGQIDGGDYECAMISRGIWKEVCTAAHIWHDEVGSLHLAYDPDEWDVLQELYELYRYRGYELTGPQKVMALSPAVKKEGLKGGLFSDQEMIVDPRKTSAAIAEWLAKTYNVTFYFATTVTAVDHPRVFCNDVSWSADEIYLCNGADFDNLFGSFYRELPVTRCKLQMMRTGVQPGGWRIGPALCGGLSLIHYKGFKAAKSLALLHKKFESAFPDYLKGGIHVMVSQMENGELIIGDSHEYGYTLDGFDSGHINQLILDYLNRFACISSPVIAETWNGTYTKMTDGSTHLLLEPASGVTIINGLGGAGMTLSFGLCESIIKSRSQ